mgnify:CR=1 FL=1
MSTIPYNFKRNDTLPVISLAVLNSDGNAYDFSDYVTVRFIMCEDNTGRAVKVNATANPPVANVLSYQLDPSDSDTAMTYLAEFQVEFATGDISTFPESGYMHILIEEDLDAA